MLSVTVPDCAKQTPANAVITTVSSVIFAIARPALGGSGLADIEAINQNSPSFIFGKFEKTLTLLKLHLRHKNVRAN
jgi:hypothetical protein